MAKDITKELLETIKATLPETQVGLIKNALVERDDLKERLEQAEAENKQAREDFDRLHDEKQTKERILSEVEKELETVVRNYNTLKADNNRLIAEDVRRQVEIAHAELRGVKDTQDAFLRNTVVRERLQHQVVDEHPNMQSTYVNGQNVWAQHGVNKTHRGVTDVKETGTAVEDKEDTCKGGC